MVPHDFHQLFHRLYTSSRSIQDNGETALAARLDFEFLDEIPENFLNCRMDFAIEENHIRVKVLLKFSQFGIQNLFYCAVKNWDRHFFRFLVSRRSSFRDLSFASPKISPIR